MLQEQKLHSHSTFEYSVNECSSEDSGETSSRARPSSALVEGVKTIRINDRSSPIHFNRNQNHQRSIFKSKSGQSIKDFEKRQETYVLLIKIY